MIIYNITIKVDHSILGDWLNWQMEEHIPEVMATNLFTDYKFYKLLNQDESDGVTYVVQFMADNMNNYEQYITQFAPFLREKTITLWGDKFIAFRTLLESVQ